MLTFELRIADRPIFMTFFEQFEAKETARLIASSRETFSASSLNVSTCNDISHGVFARSSAAALHPSVGYTVRVPALHTSNKTVRSVR